MIAMWSPACQHGRSGSIVKGFLFSLSLVSSIQHVWEHLSLFQNQIPTFMVFKPEWNKSRQKAAKKKCLWQSSYIMLTQLTRMQSSYFVLELSRFLLWYLDKVGKLTLISLISDYRSNMSKFRFKWFVLLELWKIHQCCCQVLSHLVLCTDF